MKTQRNPNDPYGGIKKGPGAGKAGHLYSGLFFTGRMPKKRDRKESREAERAMRGERHGPHGWIKSTRRGV